MKFSEFDEEPFVLDFFKCKTDGFFVDIGANNGWKGSNTHALALLGWAGMCVEADPETFKNLKKTYHESGNVTCFNFAVFNCDGQIEFQRDVSVEDSGLSRVGCFASDEVRHPSISQIKVECRRLDSIICHVSEIDFLSIDAEGCDWDILQSYSFRIRPCLVMVEFGVSTERFDQIMTPKGYIRVFTNASNCAYALNAK